MKLYGILDGKIQVWMKNMKYHPHIAFTISTIVAISGLVGTSKKKYLKKLNV